MVPHGVEHRMCAEEGSEVIRFEPKGVLNTGNARDEAFTAPIGVKI
ncbi:MAG TPA: hypothetical protein VGP19_12640 [Candidatus Acidoferrales bacterium]|nr:hypothetical protein [Candidatus Acidoferrales bacterium]